MPGLGKQQAQRVRWQRGHRHVTFGGERHDGAAILRAELDVRYMGRYRGDIGEI